MGDVEFVRRCVDAAAERLEQEYEIDVPRPEIEVHRGDIDSDTPAGLVSPGKYDPLTNVYHSNISAAMALAQDAAAQTPGDTEEEDLYRLFEQIILGSASHELVHTRQVHNLGDPPTEIAREVYDGFETVADYLAQVFPEEEPELRREQRYGPESNLSFQTGALYAADPERTEAILQNAVEEYETWAGEEHRQREVQEHLRNALVREVELREDSVDRYLDPISDWLEETEPVHTRGEVFAHLIEGHLNGGQEAWEDVQQDLKAYPHGTELAEYLEILTKIINIADVEQDTAVRRLVQNEEELPALGGPE